MDAVCPYKLMVFNQIMQHGNPSTAVVTTEIRSTSRIVIYVSSFSTVRSSYWQHPSTCTNSFSLNIAKAIINTITTIPIYACNRNWNVFFFYLLDSFTTTCYGPYGPSSSATEHQSSFYGAISTIEDPLFCECLHMWCELLYILQFSL
jgi:hypothetical protein